MNHAETLIYLTSCCLNNVTAKLNNADWDMLYTFARGHNMSALAAKALMPTDAFRNAGKDIQKKWSDRLDASIKRTMLFNAERKRITSFLEEHGIWYIPLKGAVLNEMYPCFGTREFADNDILYDRAFYDDVKNYMLRSGYKLKDDGFVADEYTKPPAFNFEMHSMLFREKKPNDPRIAFYNGMLMRKVAEPGKRFSFRMSNEDFYIYFIIHAFKHYDSCGTGFRTVSDEYVLLHSDDFDFDRGFVAGELEKLGMKEFEENLRTLAEKTLSSPESFPGIMERLNDDEKDMLIFILSCSTFGKRDNSFKKEFEAVSDNKKHSKRKYYLKRVFPGVSRYRYTNPFVYKHKIVYPFFWIYRTTVYPIAHRSSLKTELKAISKMEKSSKDKK